MATINLTMRQGATFEYTFRWETAPIVYKAITAITATAPVSITAAAHGLVSGWRSSVVSVQGMTEINSTPPLRARDYHLVSVVDADTITLNAVNAAEYTPYTGGGYLQYNTPKDMSGYTARMQIRTRVRGAVLIELTTENGGILIDNVGKTIDLVIEDEELEALDSQSGVYDLEMISATGEVTALAQGTVSISAEVTIPVV
jgi:hypothetical protein